MLDSVFEILLSSGNLKFFAAFAWGVASVILSPCGIAIVPLVVSYVSNSENPSRIHAFKISIAFCAGILVNLMLVAFVMSSFGILFGGYERFLTIFTAVIFVLMGLQLTGILRLRFRFLPGSKIQGNESQNLRGAVLLGILSGLSVGACNIAYVSPILSIAMSLASRNFLGAIFLIISYALGYCFVLVICGTFTQIASAWLQSERGDFAMKIVNIICGVVLIFSGAYLLYELRYYF